MRLLIVDDEALARLRLRTLVGDIATQLDPEPVVVAEAGDAEQALALLLDQSANAPIDVVLLDIRMPGPGSNPGLRLAAELRLLPSAPSVIFVTAHAEHALRAFEIDAVDYLTKPVRRERLLAALQRVQARRGQASRLPSAVPSPLPPAASEPVLVVSARGRVLRIPLAEVIYLKAEQKSVILRTAQHSHVLDESLAELEPRLIDVGHAFTRVHRNALVARHAIRELMLRKSDDDGAPMGDGERWAVRVAPLDEWLSVSRRQVSAVRAALEDAGRNSASLPASVNP